MQLKISHTTEYSYDKPIQFGLQHLRMTPKTRDGQRVLDWSIDITGGRIEVEFEDQHNNQVTLAGFPAGAEQISIVCAGTVVARALSAFMAATRRSGISTGSRR